MDRTLQTGKEGRQGGLTMGATAIASIDQEPGDDFNDDALRITHALQTTLQVPALLEVFHSEVAARIPLSGLEYFDDQGQLVCKLGIRANHTCSYHLKIGDLSLGTLNFRRRRKFEAAEITQLENLLCGLLYPLRNARLYQEALALAQKDPLTGICNRAAFDEALGNEVALSRRHGTPLALIIFDIDHFKAINDTYGHARGDCALKEVAQTAKICARASDTLFRYGGEEFVMLLRNTTQRGAQLLADRIRRRVANLDCRCDGETIKLTVSAGVAALEKDDTAQQLFEKADQALYLAKTKGRNRTVLAAAS